MARCAEHLKAIAPKTVFLPWRRDPHRDHRAAWQLVKASIEVTGLRPRCLEYPIWFWNDLQNDLQNQNNVPELAEFDTWRLDISMVANQKRAAIAAHRSQTGGLIDDDPTGFQLDRETLRHFEHPWELFFEPRHER